MERPRSPETPAGFALRCALAGLVILVALAATLAWLPVRGEFRAECARLHGAFVPGTEGAADLCISPGPGAAGSP